MLRTDEKPNQKVTPDFSAEPMVQTPNLTDTDSKVVNQEQLKIIDWLKKVRFQKQLFGGINEEDVWKKIYQLNEMYDAALKVERIRYDVLLDKQSKDCGLSAQISDPTKGFEVDE